MQKKVENYELSKKCIAKKLAFITFGPSRTLLYLPASSPAPSCILHTPLHIPTPSRTLLHPLAPTYTLPHPPIPTSTLPDPSDLDAKKVVIGRK